MWAGSCAWFYRKTSDRTHSMAGTGLSVCQVLGPGPCVKMTRLLDDSCTIFYLFFSTLLYPAHTKMLQSHRIAVFLGRPLDITAPYCKLLLDAWRSGERRSHQLYLLACKNRFDDHRTANASTIGCAQTFISALLKYTGPYFKLRNKACSKRVFRKLQLALPIA